MTRFTQGIRRLALVALGLGALATPALGQQARTLLGVDCGAPPLWHCPDTECLAAVVTQERRVRRR